jgi:hypothetical protein
MIQQYFAIENVFFMIISFYSCFSAFIRQIKLYNIFICLQKLIPALNEK